MNSGPVVFRVGMDGRIRAVSQGSGGFSTCAVGRPCHQVVNARAPCGTRRCGTDCVRRLTGQAPLEKQVGYVLVQRHPHRMRCTPVGEEVVVALEPCPKGIYAEPLTPRECEVLRWVACGKTSREIGTILGISSGTVRIHNERIRAKLRVHTRAQAVATGLALGILEHAEGGVDVSM